MEQYLKIKAGIKDGENSEAECKVEEVDEESDVETKLHDAITAVKNQQEKEEKRKKKKLLKERKKVEEKTKLYMIIPGDVGPTDTAADSLFTLKTIRSIDDVDKLIVKPDLPDVEEGPDDDDLDRIYERYQSKLVHYNKDDEVLDSSGKFYRKPEEKDKNLHNESSDSEEEPDLSKGLGVDSDDDEQLSISEAEVDMDKIAPILDNHLLTDLDPSNKTQKRLKKVAMWFDKVRKHDV